GGENRFSQDFETSKLSQRNAEVDFFADKEFFIKSADRIEVLARGEKERPGSQVQAEVNCAENFQKYPCPSRNFSGGNHARAAAGKTIANGIERAIDMMRINSCVGVHEKKNLPVRMMRAGVARRSDLPSINRNYFRAGGCGHFSRRVSR